MFYTYYYILQVLEEKYSHALADEIYEGIVKTANEFLR